MEGLEASAFPPVSIQASDATVAAKNSRREGNWFITEEYRVFCIYLQRKVCHDHLLTDVHRRSMGCFNRNRFNFGI